MRSLLVTGGAGFIGSNFVRYWLERHADDHVVVDRAIVSPEQFLETNVLGTHVLLEAARAVGLERFHHVSTDEVYGSLARGEPPFTENSPCQPNSPYAASKAASDHLVRAYHHTYAVPTTVTNCSNNYGPYQFPEKLIPLIVLNALEGKPLPIYGDGLNVRDWLHVEDHCRAIDLVRESGKVGEVYNVAGGNQWSNLALVQLLCRLLDETFAGMPDLAGRFPRCPASRQDTAGLISFVQDRPGHDRRYAVDAEKIRASLGFAPREALESGLRKTVQWYLSNEAWWKAVMTGAYRDWMRQWYGQDA